AGATTEMKLRNPAWRILTKAVELALQEGAAAVILVTEVDINVIDPDGPGGDNRAFEKTMRVAFEVIAVLERSGLALVDIDRHHPRSGFRRNDSPFATGREAGAAETSKTRILHQCDDISRRSFSPEARSRE